MLLTVAQSGSLAHFDTLRLPVADRRDTGTVFVGGKAQTFIVLDYLSNSPAEHSSPGECSYNPSP
ncbi:hypothetical protein HOR38_gp04 [Klebsiella phage KPV811]|uniref:Uncharacterized protein n=1 Tax=Klebsiella phage KPV811 TaxID=1913574 RepID=A0A1J0MHK6_9CAUD|nr:hypothetical protein HOR38_gp04 [Klebsiella phage KPV811]APD20659.1 hypothetical protein [Klebsiella phage KPV811]